MRLKVDISKLDFVIRYFESVRNDLAAVESVSNTFTTQQKNFFTKRCIAGARLDADAEGIQCPICIEMGIKGLAYDDRKRRCEACPVSSACWPTQDSAYNRIMAALKNDDPKKARHAVSGAIADLKKIQAQSFTGGSFSVEVDA